MRTLVLLAVLTLLAVKVLAQDLELGQGDNVFYIDEEQPELQRPVCQSMLQRMVRQKPRPDQFVSAMGKRNSQQRNLQSKRQGANSFIGLMGKRSIDQGSAERNPIQNAAWDYK